MFNQWALALQIPLLALVIPAAIIIGQRVRGGPLVVAGAAALLAFVAFWLVGTTRALSGGNPFNGVSLIYIFFGGVILLLGAWALALAQAVSERRWAWVALLSLAVYLTFAALFAIALSPYSACMFAPQQPYCASTNQTMQALLTAGSFMGPGAILVFALRAYLPRRGAPPVGLNVSRLGATDDEPGSEPEAL